MATWLAAQTKLVPLERQSVVRSGPLAQCARGRDRWYFQSCKHTASAECLQLSFCVSTHDNAANHFSVWVARAATRVCSQRALRSTASVGGARDGPWPRKRAVHGRQLDARQRAPPLTPGAARLHSCRVRDFMALLRPGAAGTHRQMMRARTECRAANPAFCGATERAARPAQARKRAVPAPRVRGEALCHCTSLRPGAAGGQRQTTRAMTVCGPARAALHSAADRVARPVQAREPAVPAPRVRGEARMAIILRNTMPRWFICYNDCDLFSLSRHDP